jgi:hypothetical protein
MTITHWKQDGKNVTLDKLTHHHLDNAIAWLQKKQSWLADALTSLEEERTRRICLTQDRRIEELRKASELSYVPDPIPAYGPRCGSAGCLVCPRTTPDLSSPAGRLDAAVKAIPNAPTEAELASADLAIALGIAVEELKSIARSSSHCGKKNCSCCFVDARGAEAALAKVKALSKVSR